METAAGAGAAGLSGGVAAEGLYFLLLLCGLAIVFLIIGVLCDGHLIPAVEVSLHNYVLDGFVLTLLLPHLPICLFTVSHK
jgi:hypothetical protein